MGVCTRSQSAEIRCTSSQTRVAGSGDGGWGKTKPETYRQTNPPKNSNHKNSNRPECKSHAFQTSGTKDRQPLRLKVQVDQEHKSNINQCTNTWNCIHKVLCIKRHKALNHKMDHLGSTTKHEWKRNKLCLGTRSLVGLCPYKKSLRNVES